MPGQPPPFNLTSEPIDGGRCWHLPRRPWGAGWFMPWLFIVVGLAVGAIFGLNGPVTLPNFDDHPMQIIGDIVSLLGDLIFSMIGLGLTFVGLTLRYAHTTVTLTHHQLSTTDRFGPLSWTRRIDTARLTGFEINIGTSSTNGGPQVPTNNVTTLTTHTDLPARFPSEKGNSKNEKRQFLVAWGYPKIWMQQLTDALTVGNEAINPQLAELETITTIGSDDDGQGENETPIAPPANTKIILHREADGLTFTVPPAGIMRGSKGLGCFAVVWNGFILLMLGFIIFTTLNAHKPNVTAPNNPWELLFLLPFIAIGIGLILFSIHTGKSRVSLVVVGSGPEAVLAYYRHSPVRKPRELSWTMNELSHLRVGDSNISVNDVPVQELQVHPKEGKKVGLLAQLEDEELRWIAYELRQQMGLSRRALSEHDA